MIYDKGLLGVKKHPDKHHPRLAGCFFTGEKSFIIKHTEVDMMT